MDIHETCVRKPPLKLTLVIDVERWLSYKGTCHVILLAKLHDMSLKFDCKWIYMKTCVRKPPLKLTLVVDVERWLSYKGTCHVILLAKLHDMSLKFDCKWIYMKPV